MVPVGTRGSQDREPSSARSDLSCQHSRAKGPPANLLGCGAWQRLRAPLKDTGRAGSRMPTLPRGSLGQPVLGRKTPGIHEKGRCQGACQAVEKEEKKKVPGERLGPGRWRCFDGALGGPIALTWVMRRSAPVFSSSLKMMSGL